MASLWQFSAGVDFTVEYLLGFGFGWGFFQAFAMREMAGGSYMRSLRMTFLPEFLSMNVLMAGMLVSMHWLMPRVDGGADPASPGFWFAMSMALIAGFCLAYPVNWWLVANGMKHGMISVRAAGDSDHVGADDAAGTRQSAAPQEAPHPAVVPPSSGAEIGAIALTLATLTAGIVVSSRLS